MEDFNFVFVSTPQLKESISKYERGKSEPIDKRPISLVPCQGIPCLSCPLYGWPCHTLTDEKKHSIFKEELERRKEEKNG